MLEVKGINKSYKDKQVLNDVSFSIKEGEILGLFGPNGSGKSTLINIIALAGKADSGSIKINNVNALENQKEVRKIIGYVPQDIALFEELTVKDNLLCWSRENTKKTLAKADNIAEELDLKHIYNQKIMTLSGGMKRRVNLAVALLEKPKLLVLDEPFAGMDYEHTEDVEILIKKLASTGVSIIISEHSPRQMANLVDKMLVLKFGKVLFNGKTEEFLKFSEKNDANEATRNILNRR